MKRRSRASAREVQERIDRTLAELPPIGEYTPEPTYLKLGDRYVEIPEKMPVPEGRVHKEGFEYEP